MVRKSVIAVLWAASLVAAASVAARGAQTPQPTSVSFSAKRIAADNGFTLVQAYSSPYVVDCFLVYEGPKGVAMAPAKCP